MALKTLQLTVGEVANTEGVANAAQKNRGVVDLGTLLRHIAEGQCSAVIGGFLFEYGVLLTLAGDGCLVGTKDFVGLCYR